MLTLPHRAGRLGATFAVAIVALLGLLFPLAASAQVTTTPFTPNPTGTPSTAPGGVLTPTTIPPAPVTTTPGAGTAPATPLARTGKASGSIALAGALAIGVGAAALLGARRLPRPVVFEV